MRSLRPAFVLNNPEESLGREIAVMMFPSGHPAARGDFQQRFIMVDIYLIEEFFCVAIIHRYRPGPIVPQGIESEIDIGVGRSRR